jgi:hypothetical protein
MAFTADLSSADRTLICQISDRLLDRADIAWVDLDRSQQLAAQAAIGFML